MSSPQKNPPPKGPHVITYRATLDVPRELVEYLATLLRAHRRVLGTRKGTRILTPWRQAVFGLAWFRNRGVDIPQLGAGFGLSRATSYRRHDEVLAVLSAQAPDLTDALTRVEAEGWSHVILDGKVVDSDRHAQKTVSRKGDIIDAWYSGKTHDFGGNIQAVMRPDGFPIWTSDVEPGSVHDLTTAREHALGPLYAAASRGLPTLADAGYEGAGQGIFCPIKKPADGHHLHIDNRTYNMLLRSMRCLGERGFALLSQRWRVLQGVTQPPRKIGDIARAALVLTHFEHGYIPW
jgi:DDE superfamily endonuclease